MIPASAFCVLHFSLLISAAITADDSLVKNGDFENGAADWEAVHKDKGTFNIEENGGIDGPQFLRLKPSDSAYPALYAMQQLIKPPVEGGKYKFRARVRISDDYAGRMPMVEVNFKPPREEKVRYIHISVPKDAEPGKWTTLEADVDLPEDVPGMYVHLFVFGAMGHADFDGVEMVPAAKNPASPPRSDRPCACYSAVAGCSMGTTQPGAAVPHYSS